LKRSNDDLSVRDALGAALTGGRMNPIMARWGMRGMDDCTVEDLARLPQKLDGGSASGPATPSAHGAGRG